MSDKNVEFVKDLFREMGLESKREIMSFFKARDFLDKCKQPTKKFGKVAQLLDYLKQIENNPCFEYMELEYVYMNAIVTVFTNKQLILFNSDNKHALPFSQAVNLTDAFSIETQYDRTLEIKFQINDVFEVTE